MCSTFSVTIPSLEGRLHDYKSRRRIDNLNETFDAIFQFSFLPHMISLHVSEEIGTENPIRPLRNYKQWHTYPVS